MHNGARLEYPNRRLIMEEADGADSFSDGTSEGGTDEGSSLRSFEDFGTEEMESEERRIVLHPTESTYAIRYPDFDAFAGRSLIDNGYVTTDNNQCRAVIVRPGSTFNQDLKSVDYLNTLFAVPDNNDMEG